jgi:hypothetical protein
MKSADSFGGHGHFYGLYKIWRTPARPPTRFNVVIVTDLFLIATVLFWILSLPATPAALQLGVLEVGFMQTQLIPPAYAFRAETSSLETPIIAAQILLAQTITLRPPCQNWKLAHSVLLGTTQHSSRVQTQRSPQRVIPAVEPKPPQ